MTEIFTPAILEMERQNICYSEPRSFQDYLKNHGIAAQKTASLISVQTLNGLNPELRRGGYMVFRLGSRPEAKNTYFALAKLSSSQNWSEYFLLDEQIFSDCQPQLFLPNVSIRQLFAFNLLSSLTENSLINLAIASGLHLVSDSASGFNINLVYSLG